jgi:hypothetical protein
MEELTGLSHSPEDEKKYKEFHAFVKQIEADNKSYFKDKTLNSYYAYWSGKVPPAIRLRYISSSKLDEKIKTKIEEKYKEIFGDTADLQDL